MKGEITNWKKERQTEKEKIDLYISIYIYQFMYLRLKKKKIERVIRETIWKKKNEKFE